MNHDIFNGDADVLCPSFVIGGDRTKNCRDQPFAAK